MLFRIVGHHKHHAMLGSSTFSCLRQSTATDAGLSVHWTACKDNVILKKDCRTLNEAKRLCRSMAAATPAGNG